MIKISTRKQIKILLTNNELEFCLDEFNASSKTEGIVRYHNVASTWQQTSCEVDERNYHGKGLLYDF